ncbi:hypothetical protein B0H16DRAFT_1455040 [Mycena metata]|uniref:Uncharacterized protein n=1 Tax=Mycena metata TaxID=1033252 RepID=A0AAD7JFM2_9AGAR|nr:hypothetical protein B0H16DRAFT_1455040 [Mycena metata]
MTLACAASIALSSLASERRRMQTTLARNFGDFSKKRIIFAAQSQGEPAIATGLRSKKREDLSAYPQPESNGKSAVGACGLTDGICTLHSFYFAIPGRPKRWIILDWLGQRNSQSIFAPLRFADDSIQNQNFRRRCPRTTATEK